MPKLKTPARAAAVGWRSRQPGRPQQRARCYLGRRPRVETRARARGEAQTARIGARATQKGSAHRPVETCWMVNLLTVDPSPPPVSPHPLLRLLLLLLLLPLLLLWQYQPVPAAVEMLHVAAASATGVQPTLHTVASLLAAPVELRREPWHETRRAQRPVRWFSGHRTTRPRAGCRDQPCQRGGPARPIATSDAAPAQQTAHRSPTP